MATPYRVLLGGLATLLVGSLAVATFWPGDDAGAPAVTQRADVADVAAVPIAEADAVPASRSIFPKVLNH
jgi:hypothetical protein